MIDLSLLKEEIDTVAIAEYIGMDIVKKGSYNFILCPGHENRLGRPDIKASNCYLTSNGYHCTACGVSVNAINMIMEFTGCSYGKALHIAADACGGAALFEDNSSEIKEAMPLSALDLAIIGLKNYASETPIINSADAGDGSDTEIIRIINGEEVLCEKGISPLLSLYKKDKDAYNRLILASAKAAAEKYETVIEKYCSRASSGAFTISKYFSDNDGCIDDEVFVGLKNAFQRKLQRATAIIKQFETVSK